MRTVPVKYSAGPLLEGCEPLLLTSTRLGRLRSGRAWNEIKSGTEQEEEDACVMLPVVGMPETVRKALRPYRDLFRREEGFEYVSRYMTGLLGSPNKTLQGIYATQVWPEKKPSRRAMHEAVFEAEWNAEELLPRHRALIAPEHRKRGAGSDFVGLDVGAS
jgi:hypothetical protein